MGAGLADNLPEAGCMTAARSLTEAILWHGGEANTSKERLRTATSADRNAIIEFLRSL